MRLLLISSTIVHGYGYLEYDEANLRRFLGDRKRIAFIPFAQFDRNANTNRFREAVARMGYDVTQVHEANDIEAADAIYTSGGNTFRLLKTLYDRNLIELIRKRVRNEGGAIAVEPAQRDEDRSRHHAPRIVSHAGARDVERGGRGELRPLARGPPLRERAQQLADGHGAIAARLTASRRSALNRRATT